MLDIKGNVICFITGASQGFGRCIIEALVRENFFNSKEAIVKFILCARSVKGLEETKQLLQTDIASKKNITIDIASFDIECFESIRNIFIETVLNSLTDKYDHCFIFNNAGIIGNISSSFDEFQISDIQSVFKVNVIHSIFIISQICKHFKNSNKYIINTSTLGAIQPLSSMSLYCSSKAAMDMFIRNISADKKDIRSLNYAPGPLDTNMASDIAENSSSSEIQTMFKEMFDKGTILKPYDSAKKLINILKQDAYENASHVDFFDVEF